MSWRPALPLILCLAPLAWQIFVPPVIGLANNGDFAKVSGRFSLGPRYETEQDTFLFFIREWKYTPKFHWVSDYFSSETALVWLATSLSRLFGEREFFDMRVLGAVHAAIFGIFCAIVARALGSLRLRYAALAFVVLVFSDVSYVSYFNSFYMDTAALLFLLTTIALLGLLLLEKQPSPALFTAFALSAALLITAKAPHAPLGLLLAAFVARLAFRNQSRPSRIAAAAAAVVLLALSAGMLARTTVEYKGTGLFNLIFFKLAKNSPEPDAVLREFGLDARYRSLVGTHAFEAGSPAKNSLWLNDFYRRSGGYSKAAAQYLHRPALAVGVLWDDLKEEAPRMRAVNLGNYERSTGAAAGALTASFGWWSGLRSTLLKRAPWHLPLWFAGFAACSLYFLKRSRTAELGLLLTAMAGYEFALASLADACETYRHLFLFHAITDATICLAVIGLAARLSLRYESRGQGRTVAVV